MSLESSIRSAVLADESIAAIVGDRMVPLMLAPTEPIDSIVFRIVNRTSEMTMDGPPDDGAGTSTLQLAARSADYDRRGELTELIIARLDGLDGVFDGFDLTFFLADASDNTPAPMAGEELPPEYGDQIDFTVLFNRVP